MNLFKRISVIYWHEDYKWDVCTTLMSKDKSPEVKVQDGSLRLFLSDGTKLTFVDVNRENGRNFCADVVLLEPGLAQESANVVKGRPPRIFWCDLFIKEDKKKEIRVRESGGAEELESSMKG